MQLKNKVNKNRVLLEYKVMEKTHLPLIKMDNLIIETT